MQGTKGFNKPTQLRTQALLKDKGLVWCDDSRPGGVGTPAERADFLPSAPPLGCPSVACVPTAHVRPLVHHGILFWALWKFYFMKPKVVSDRERNDTLRNESRGPTI